MFKCKSLTRETMWYEVDTKGWDIGWSTRETSSNFADVYFEWPDLGHDGAQHETKRPVHLDHAADCMGSIAKYLLDNPAALENECVGLIIPDAPDRKTVEFLVGLKPTAKTRYYSLRDLKISNGDSKRYDTRYVVIDEQCNGSQDFVARALLAVCGSKNCLARIAMAVYAAEIMDEAAYSPFRNIDFREWFPLRDAFRALRIVIDAHRAMVQAKSHVDCYLRNIENAKRLAQEEAENNRQVAIGAYLGDGSVAVAGA